MLQTAPVLIPPTSVLTHFSPRGMSSDHNFAECACCIPDSSEKPATVTLYGDTKFDLMVVIQLCLNVSIDKCADVPPDTTVHSSATQPHVSVH
jgi:hypothetical protein